MAISFLGGTTQQQQLITTAHNNASTAITRAGAQAALGSGAFTTWFGPATLYAIQSASIIYSVMGDFMSGTSFTYDLTQTPQSRRAQDIYLNVPEFEGNQITLTVWQGFWNTFQTNSTAMTKYLALSVIYMASIFRNYEQGAVLDKADVLNADDAMFLAQYRPGDAITSSLNYAYYASAYLPAPSESSQS